MQLAFISLYRYVKIAIAHAFKLSETNAGQMYKMASVLIEMQSAIGARLFGCTCKNMKCKNIQDVGRIEVQSFIRVRLFGCTSKNKYQKKNSNMNQFIK